MLPPPESELHRLMTQFPRTGEVRWIGLRPARDVPMRAVDSAEAVAGKGLRGDRYGSGSGKRGITLIQAEHLPAIAALTGIDAIEPATLRRNLVVSGIPLIALKGRRFRIGEVLCEGTAPCDHVRAWSSRWAPAVTTRCAATAACARGSCPAANSSSATR